MEKKDGLMFLGRVPEDRALSLVNKKKIRSLQELSDSFEDMGDDVFGYHVSFNKNDFSRWIKSEIKDSWLAQMVSLSDSKDEIAELVHARINEIKSGAAAGIPLRGSSDKSAPVKEAVHKAGSKLKKKAKKPRKAKPVPKVKPAANANSKNQASAKKAEPKKAKNMAKNQITPKARKAEAKPKAALVSVSGESMFFSEGIEPISGLKGLAAALKKNDFLFERHVGDGYDHFADWISNALQLKNIAEKLRKIKDKKKYISAIEDSIYAKNIKSAKVKAPKQENKAEARQNQKPSARKQEKKAAAGIISLKTGKANKKRFKSKKKAQKKNIEAKKEADIPASKVTEKKAENKPEKKEADNLAKKKAEKKQSWLKSPIEKIKEEILKTGEELEKMNEKLRTKSAGRKSSEKEDKNEMKKMPNLGSGNYSIDSAKLKEIIDKENIIIEKEKEIELRERKILEIEERIESKINQSVEITEKKQKKERMLSKDFLQGILIGILITILLALVYIKFISPLGLIPWP